MLEFAAAAPDGRGELVLREHRAALELVRLSLRDRGSPYADVLDAVCLTLGEPSAADRARRRSARRHRPAAGARRARAVRAARGDADTGGAAMSAGEILLWIILPVRRDHGVRRRALVALPARPVRVDEPLDPAARPPSARLGQPGLFHYGALAAVGGHVIGLCIPASFTEALGISENIYRWFAAIAGGRRGAPSRWSGFVGLRLPAGDQRPGAPQHHAHGRRHLLPAHCPDRHGLLDDLRPQPRDRPALQLPRLDR